MAWLVVLEILLRLFGPILADLLDRWLERVLAEAAAGMGGGPSRDPEAFRADLAALFDRARRRTWVWQLRKRAAVRLAERMVLERSEEIRRSAAQGGGYVPRLTTAEQAELKAAVA